MMGWCSKKKKRASPDYLEKLARLREETEFAETVQGIVEAREPFYERLGSELRVLRLENHFTPLFLDRIGPHR